MSRHAFNALLATAVTAAALVVAPPLAAGAGTSNIRDVCGPAKPGHARCLAKVRTDVHGGFGVRGRASVTGTTSPPGYGPADLQSAYKLPASRGAGQTVAVVDAGDDPNAEADLAVYRATYGLAPCTTANGCFRKVDQDGAADPLPPDQGWAIEIALDLDMVSAACPACHILLVEGDDESFGALATAENTAARLGAREISNSYGATETHAMFAYAAAYSHPGVAILASSGDDGFGIPIFPANLASVVAVGGTSLTRDTTASRGWAETAWSGAGSGCSAWIDKPAWQHDANCPGRMTADVAADADPETGPAVYDSFDQDGWLVVGGTSASSPFIAGVIALAGNPAVFANASYIYAHAGSLNDITRGSNSSGAMDCGGDYQCTAVAGYDGPTGNGTPNGVASL
jgi:subtilase family serine protease